MAALSAFSIPREVISSYRNWYTLAPLSPKECTTTGLSTKYKYTLNQSSNLNSYHLLVKVIVHIGSVISKGVHYHRALYKKKYTVKPSPNLYSYSRLTYELVHIGSVISKGTHYHRAF
jgi:hypothetical protein